MNTVTVKASGQYDVKIGSGLLQTLGAEAAQVLKGRSVCLVSDSNVAPLYGAAATAALEAAGFSVCSFVFPAGEQSKCAAVWLELLNVLAENRLTRADGIIALGGGVTGDMAGFAAATYLRGISYLQVPTSLLAMVDSSVGGKTAIDLSAGKNLCGAFCQPRLVLCDTDCLRTLPRRMLRSGCAEVIKYGVLGSRTLFDRLKDGPDNQDWPWVITQCVSMKRDIVEEDEFDTGRRQCLNLGHTLGHAIEANSGFALSHGEAVSIGMARIAAAAVRFGLCDPADSTEIRSLLEAFGLPVETDQSPEAIVSTALGDKKRQGDTLTLIVPRRIGCCDLHKIPVSQLSAWI